MLERPGELAAPKAQQLLMAAQPESCSDQTVHSHLLHRTPVPLTGPFVAKVANPWLHR